MRYYQNKPIRDWAEEDQPREKMYEKGAGALTDAELISVLIATGNKEYSAIDIGRKLLDEFGSLSRISRATVQELMLFPGIGKAKAVSLVATFELQRRKEQYESSRITYRHSREMAAYARPIIGDLPNEAFLVMFFNANLELLGHKVIHSGGVSHCLVDPKLVFKEAVNYLATQIVVAHNHPSGNERPSREDVMITQKLKDAGKLLDIHVLDHLIIGGQGKFYSFSDNHYLEPLIMDIKPGPAR